MLLYRGVKNEPQWYDPELEMRCEAQIAKQEAIAANGDYLKAFIEAARSSVDRMSAPLGDQIFTDDKKIARDCAGPNGYLITINVPDNIVGKHYYADEFVRSKDALSSNFAFGARELAKNRSTWQLQVEKISAKNDKVFSTESIREVELRAKLESLKVGDIIVSETGTRRRVISVEGDLIETVCIKGGKVVPQVLSRKADFIDQNFSWVRDIEEGDDDLW